jgi:FMN reductase
VQIAVVTGNPKAQSRTLEAATNLATAVAGPPTTVVDVIELGPGLLTWGDEPVTAAVEAVRAADVAVFASPTYKATYTGLLKLFLDLFPSDGLRGVVGIPLMLGAGPGHALAPELLLKPVLVELGATCPTKGLYLLESNYTGTILDPWLDVARPQVQAAVAGLRRPG